jgi:hypothetical protein
MNCDPNALMQAAACYRCIPAGSLPEVITSLTCQWANSAAPQVVYRSSFSTDPTAAGLRNNLTATVGFSFQVLLATTVKRLGREYFAGDLQNHPIGLWITASTTLIATGTILVASPLEGAFRWVDVAPVNLSPGIGYTIGVLEFNGGDSWKDIWVPTTFLDSTYVDTASVVNRFNVGAVLTMPANTNGGNMNAYGCPAFWHST